MLTNSKFLAAAWLLILCALPAFSQSEAGLRSFFEGRSVTVKLDMPASKYGIDVAPGELQPLNYQEYAKRLKRFGTSLRKGDSTLITKIKVKKDLIEFHLGGGGFGTVGDDSSDSVFVPNASKTTREKNLERDLKRESDPKKKRQLQEELDSLKKDRQREDARNEAIIAAAEVSKQREVREKAAQSGSRFNIRYVDFVPPTQLTPESVMAALAPYVEFSATEFGSSASGGANSRTTATAEHFGKLRRGMTASEVEDLLGVPKKREESREGRYRAVVSTYDIEGMQVETEFVEGILVRISKL